MTPFSVLWLKQLRTNLVWQSGRQVLQGTQALTNDQRTKITQLTRALQVRLKPMDNRTDLVVEIGKLLAAFPTQAQGASDSPAKLRVAAYLEALADFPAWAVTAARRRIIKGHSSLDPKWCPTPPQMAQEAARLTDPVRQDLRDLLAIESAPTVGEIPAEERARVSAGFRQLQADLAFGHDTAGLDGSGFEELCKQAGVDPDTVPDAT